MRSKSRILVSVVLMTIGILMGATLASAATGADLTIKNISLTNSGVLSVDVSNAGDTDISTTTGHTYIYIDGTLKWTYSWSTLSNKDFLKAGFTSSIQPQTLSGEHTVKACVDPKNVVTESNEDNNCMEVTLGTTELPDLSIPSITLSSSNALTVNVSNGGNADVSTTSGYTYIYIDGTLTWTYKWSTLADTSFLKEGGSSSIQPQTLTGEHTIKACVDPTGVVTESNEDNNCTESTLGTPELPDFSIPSVSLSSNTLTVKVSNGGNADASTTTGYTYIYIDGVLTWTYSWSTLADTSFLKEGGSSSIQPQTLTGTHTVKACVDPTNVVTESNENNNCTESTLTATSTGTTTTTTTLPDLSIPSITLSSSNALTVNVSNGGNADVSTTSGYTYIYIDGTLTWTYSWSTLSDTYFMKAGYTSTIQPQTLTGTHTVKACVDPTNVVTESNENNNCTESTLTATSSTTTSTGTTSTTTGTTSTTTTTTTGTNSTSNTLPDLYIQNIYLNQNGTLNVRVRNRGYTDVTTTSGYTYIYIDGTLTWTYSWSTLSNTSFMKAHRSSVIQPQTLTGEHTIKACVDPTNVVTESSDDNNCLEATVGNSDEADLYVNSLWVSRNGTLNILLKNRSATDVTTTTGTVEIYVDGELTYNYSWSTLANQRFLKAHGMTILKPLVLSAGSHTVKVVVDGTNVVSESSESNNTFEGTVTVKSQN